MIKMLPGRVLVRQRTVKKIGSIILPKEELDPVGQVVSCGGDFTLPNGKVLKCPVKEGEWVMFKEIGNTKITFEDKEYLHLTFQDIILVIEE